MKTKRAQPCSPLEEIDGNNTKRRAIEGIASVEASHAMSAMMKSLATNDVSMINDATKTSLDSNETSVQEFNTHESQESANERKTQLEMYLKEPRSAIEEKLDVLSFWKAHQYRYPQLACMARDILSIPVSTVASESAFSNGGRVLDQYRSALKPETVEALVCTRDWLFGIEGDEELSIHDLTEDIMQLSELKVQEGYTTK